MSFSRSDDSGIQGYGHIFACNPLDRGEKERRDEEALTSMSLDPSSLFLLLRNLDLLVNTSDQPRLHWISRDKLHEHDPDPTPVFLGIRDSIYHYAVGVSLESFSDDAVRLIDPDLRFIDVRTCGQTLGAEDAGISAQARIQIDWHKMGMQ